MESTPIDGDKTVRGKDAQFLSYRLEDNAWRKRRVIQRRRRVSTWQAIGWLRRYGMGVREVALKD